MQIPLEDNFEDIIGKAQKGLDLNDEELAFRAGTSVAALRDLKSGRVIEGPARLIAPLLGLHADSLLTIGRGQWRPQPAGVDGLLMFTTTWGSMTVNSFLVYDPGSLAAVLIDAGADASEPLAAIRERGLRLEAAFNFTEES